MLNHTQKKNDDQYSWFMNLSVIKFCRSEMFLECNKTIFQKKDKIKLYE